MSGTAYVSFDLDLTYIPKGYKPDLDSSCISPRVPLALTRAQWERNGIDDLAFSGTRRHRRTGFSVKNLSVFPQMAVADLNVSLRAGAPAATRSAPAGSVR